MCLLVNIVEFVCEGFPKCWQPTKKEIWKTRAGELLSSWWISFFLMIVIGDKNCVFSTTLRHNVRPLNGKQNHLQGRTHFALEKARLNVILERFYIMKIWLIPEGKTVNKLLFKFLGAYKTSLRGNTLKNGQKTKLDFAQTMPCSITMPLHIGPQLVRNYLVKNSGYHPRLSTLLAWPRACWFFPVILKTSLKGEQFADAKVVKQNVTR